MKKSNWKILGVGKEEENLCKCSNFEHFHPIPTLLFLHEPRAQHAFCSVSDCILVVNNRVDEP